MRTGEKPLLEKPFSEIYPDCGSGDYFYGPSDYGPLIESFGYDVAVREDENGYDGDTFVLYRGAARREYGVLIFGWGSCSGCDALQACGDEHEVMRLREDLHDSIVWFDGKEDARAWFSDEKRGGSYYYKRDEWKNFMEAALKIIDESNES